MEYSLLQTTEDGSRIPTLSSSAICSFVHTLLAFALPTSWLQFIWQSGLAIFLDNPLELFTIKSIFHNYYSRSSDQLIVFFIGIYMGAARIFTMQTFPEEIDQINLQLCPEIFSVYNLLDKGVWKVGPSWLLGNDLAFLVLFGGLWTRGLAGSSKIPVLKILLLTDMAAIGITFLTCTLQVRSNSFWCTQMTTFLLGVSSSCLLIHLSKDEEWGHDNLKNLIQGRMFGRFLGVSLTVFTSFPFYSILLFSFAAILFITISLVEETTGLLDCRRHNQNSKLD